MLFALVGILCFKVLYDAIVQQRVDLLIGFMMLCAVLFVWGLFFQLGIKRVALDGNTVIIRGFFFGKKTISKNEVIVLKEKKPPMSFGPSKIILETKSGQKYAFIIPSNELGRVSRLIVNK